jgi:hypothetical protein
MRDETRGLPADGRQSETAVMIARGVRRLLRARGFSSLTELPLTDGRRADIAAVNRHGEVLIVEIKSSLADFRADRKWRDYAACCDRLYFAISERTPAGLMPLEAGLIIADPYGAEIVREAEFQHGAGQPQGALAALRPGRGRPAAPAGRSGSGAGIAGRENGAQRKGRPEAALLILWMGRTTQRRAPIDPSSSGGPPRSRDLRNRAPSSPRSTARESPTSSRCRRRRGCPEE